MIKRSKKIANSDFIIKFGVDHLSEFQKIYKKDLELHLNRLGIPEEVKVFDNEFYFTGDIVTNSLKNGENFIIKDFKENGTPLLSKYTNKDFENKIIEYPYDIILKIGRLK
jgi:hypothetical protein